MRIKRILSLLCCFALLASVLSGCGPQTPAGGGASDASSQSSSPGGSVGSGVGAQSEPEEVKRTPQTITVSCSTATGIGYITTTTLGAILQREYPEYIVAPEITTGSQENVNLVVQGVAQIAICMADSALAAYEGNREFTDAPIPTAGKIAFVCGGSPTGITQFMAN